MGSIIKVNEYKDFNNNDIMTSDGSGNITINAAAMKNTPAFEAYLSSAQTVSDNTTTKAQPNIELFDTDSAYDNSSTYRFTPQVAGKYLLWGVIAGYSDGSSYMNVTKSMIYKNGSVVRNATMDLRDNPGRYLMPHVQTIQEANGSSDYFEFYGVVNGTTGTQKFDASTTNFDGTRWGAYRIIGA